MWSRCPRRSRVGPTALGQHLLFDDGCGVLVALVDEGTQLLVGGDCGPVEGWFTEHTRMRRLGGSVQLTARTRRRSCSYTGASQDLVGGLGGVAPDGAQVGVGDRLSVHHEGVDDVLVQGVAVLHDDVVDQAGQSRVGQHRLEYVVVFLQRVLLAEADQAVGAERRQYRLGETMASGVARVVVGPGAGRRDVGGGERGRAQPDGRGGQESPRRFEPRLSASFTSVSPFVWVFVGGGRVNGRGRRGGGGRGRGGRRGGRHRRGGAGGRGGGGEGGTILQVDRGRRGRWWVRRSRVLRWVAVGRLGLRVGVRPGRR